jgi:hypothetical protein
VAEEADVGFPGVVDDGVPLRLQVMGRRGDPRPGTLCGSRKVTAVRAITTSGLTVRMAVFLDTALIDR